VCIAYSTKSMGPNCNEAQRETLPEIAAAYVKEAARDFADALKIKKSE
jgi:hypothetical protein